MDAHHGRLCRQSCRCPFAIGKLVARADRPERHIVRHDHADSRLDLFFCRPEGRCVGNGAAHRAVMHMVDRILSQRKHLGQSAPNFVNEQHHSQRRIAVQLSLSRSGDRHRIKIIVAEFSRRPPLGFVVAKVGAIGIPLAYGRHVGYHSLFNRTGSGCPEADPTSRV